MPRQRRDRETAKEEEITEQKQVGRTPQNKAKAKAGTRRAKSASNKDSAVTTSAENNNNNNNNNPLKKVVFVHHVLRFLKQNYVESDIESDRKKKVFSIPKFIELRHVSSSWKETVEFYNPLPQENTFTFFDHLSTLGYRNKYPSVQCSVVLHDIVGWLSNVGMAVISDKSSSSLLRDVLNYFYYCLDSSSWKEEKSGFEHHAAFVRDTLLWISKFCDFKSNTGRSRDESNHVWQWCYIIVQVITREEGEYFGFDTIEMRDVLLLLSKKYVSTSFESGVITFFELVYDLTRDNEKMQKIFGTKQVYHEFIRLSKFEELEYCDPDEESCYYSFFFQALASITDLKKNANMFATAELRNTMVRIFRKADMGWEFSPDIEIMECFSRLLRNLISTNKSNKKLFAVESVRDVMVRKYEEREYYPQGRYEVCGRADADVIFYFLHRRWTQNVTNNEGACLFFENLATLCETSPKLFLIDDTRKTLVEFARKFLEERVKVVDNKTFRKMGCFKFDISAATIRSYLTALETMLLLDEKLFFSKRIDDLLIAIKRNKQLLDDSTTLFSKIEKHYEKMKKKMQFEKEHYDYYKEQVESYGDSRPEDDKFDFWKKTGPYDDYESEDDDDDDDDYDDDLKDDQFNVYDNKKFDFVYATCYHREDREEKLYHFSW